jgi:PD-(D/E)XK nuclease superfamily
MDTSDMVLLPTSDHSEPDNLSVPEPFVPAWLQFRDLSGKPIYQPSEWTPALIELLVIPEQWDQVRLTLQGADVPVYVRHLAGGVCVLADWPRSGPGHYELRLDLLDERVGQRVTIEPEKISSSAFARMLEDLTMRLPAEVAIGLQRLGALSGIRLLPPTETTLAGELLRLRRAVKGHAGKPGLGPVLDELARDHLEVLQTVEHWVPREQARRPGLTGVMRAVALPGNLDRDRRPLHVLDTGMEHTADVYENRLVNVFAHQVLLRLRALERVAAMGSGNIGVLAEARELLRTLADARQHARFLDTVSLPVHLPNHLTMALIKRPAYRATLEGYLEFHRSVAVRIETPALEAPLENVPYLYQLWGTLHVVNALLQVAAERGYRVEQQQLIGRDGAGLYVQVLPNGASAVVLRDLAAETTVKLIPERTYGQSGALHSISYPQRPDVAVEITDVDGRTRVYLFDPKYKLAGDTTIGTDGGSPLANGKPQKVDIDKMHAYRDAIRDAEDRRAVRYAAILYPGPGVCYADGLEALHAYPGMEQDLDLRLTLVLSAAIAAP